MSRHGTLALAVLALALLATPPPVRAQQPPGTSAPPITVTAAFNRAAATIGDRVTLTITTRHGADMIVDPAPLSIAHVDLVSAGNPTTATQPGGGATTTITIVLQPFLIGAINTGTLRLDWLRADGTAGTVTVPGPTITMVAVRAAGDEALRPLKPQASVPGAPPAWVRPAIVGAAVAALLAVIALAVLLVRRRRRRIAPTAPPVDTSPERTARQQLDGLVGAADLISGDYQAYYGGIALTVRGYLGARFGFNAHALTTSELERRMVSHGVDRWQARLVGGLLERCDGAVFARRYPDPASADHDLTVAYEIVELSRPQASLEAAAAV